MYSILISIRLNILLHGFVDIFIVKAVEQNSTIIVRYIRGIPMVISGNGNDDFQKSDGGGCGCGWGCDGYWT